MPRSQGGSTIARRDLEHPRESAGPRSARLAPLLSTLEREIFPRLVVVHQAPDVGTHAHAAQQSHTHPDVAALARLAAQGQLTEALVLVEQAFRGGASVERVLLELVAPAARTLGEAWLDDTCSFTEVTAGLGTLQQLVLAFRPQDTRPTRHGTVLLLAAPGEQHTLGLFVLAELVQRAGYGTRLETAPSFEGAAALVAAERFVAVGISVSSERLLDDVATLMALLRKRNGNDLPILLGGSIDGRAFARAQGAALWATDARDALAWIDAHLTLRSGMK